MASLKKKPQVKVQRSANFTPEEKKIFIDLLKCDQFSVIENKATDAVTKDQKNNAWEELATQFNSINPSNVFRSVENLKHLWDNMKRTARKAKGEEKKEIFRTGGGSVDGQKMMSPDDEAVLAILGPSGGGGGLDVYYGGDKPHNEIGEESVLENNEESQIEENLAASPEISSQDPLTPMHRNPMYQPSWKDYTPKMLNQRKAEQLRQDPPSKRLRPFTPEGSYRIVEEEQRPIAKRRRPTSSQGLGQEPLYYESKAKLAVTTAGQMEKEEARRQEIHEMEMRHRRQMHEISLEKGKLENQLLAMQILKLRKEMGMDLINVELDYCINNDDDNNLDDHS